MNPARKFTRTGKMSLTSPAYDRDLRWLHRHYGELLEKLRNEHVAVYRGHVIAHSNSLVDLKSNLPPELDDHPETKVVIRKMWPGAYLL